MDLCNPLKRSKERENTSEKIRRPNLQDRKLVWKVEAECIYKSWLKRNCLMLIMRCVRAEWCDDCVEIRELQQGAVIDGGASGVLNQNWYRRILENCKVLGGQLHKGIEGSRIYQAVRDLRRSICLPSQKGVQDSVISIRLWGGIRLLKVLLMDQHRMKPQRV